MLSPYVSTPLAGTLKQFAAAAGTPIVYLVDRVRGATTTAVAGEFSPREALDRMLSGSALEAAHDAATGALVVSRKHTASDAPERTGTRGAMVGVCGSLVPQGGEQIQAVFNQQGPKFGVEGVHGSASRNAAQKWNRRNRKVYSGGRELAVDFRAFRSKPAPAAVPPQGRASAPPAPPTTLCKFPPAPNL